MIVSFASFFTRGLNFAIDFTGGISVEAAFPNDANIDKIRAGVEAAGYHEPQVQTFGSTRDVTIRLQSTGESAEVLRPEVREDPHERRSAGEDHRPRRGRPAGRRRTAQRRHPLAGGHAGADRRLHHPALPHLAPVARRHPRRDARSHPGARRVLDHADAVRPVGGRGHPRGHRLLAERHRHRVRPHPRDASRTTAGWRPTSRSTRPSTRRCRAPS